MRRQQDDDDRRVERQQLLQQLDAVHAGHLEIRQCKIKPAFFGKLERGFARRRGSYVAAFIGQNHLENFAL